MTPTIYILLPVHNRRLITAKFIDCLIAQSYQNYHLVLIDDGSTDATTEMVKEKVTNLTVLKGTGNWWWAGSLQQGINWLKEKGIEDREIVVFMNDDVAFARDFLEIAVQLLDQYEGILLPQILNEDSGRPEETGVEADFKKLKFVVARSQEKINCLPTRGLFMRMSDLRKVGDLHPRLLPHYLSDYEFTIRAKRKGVNLMTSSELKIASEHEETGFRLLDELPFHVFIRRLFSIKAPSNPVYWTTFVLLASPAPYVPLNLLKIWLIAARTVLKQVARIPVVGI